MNLTPQEAPTHNEVITPQQMDALCLKYIESLTDKGFKTLNRYHNFQHIKDVVLLSETFCDKTVFESDVSRSWTMLTTKCAAWFHDLYHSGKKGELAEQENISSAITSFVTFIDNTPEVAKLGTHFRDSVIRIIRSTTHPYIVGFNDTLTLLDEKIIRDADNLSVWALEINSAERSEWVEKVSGLVDEMYDTAYKYKITDPIESRYEAAITHIVRIFKMETGYLGLLKSGKLPIYTQPARDFFETRYPLIIEKLTKTLDAAKLLYPDADEIQKLLIT